MSTNYVTKKKKIKNINTIHQHLSLGYYWLFTVAVFSELVEQQEYQPENLVKLLASI